MKYQIGIPFLALIGFGLPALSSLIGACGSTTGESMQSAVVQPAATASHDQDGSRLDQLRTTRSRDAYSDKLAVGPGDVIVVTVPGVPELDKFKVRVSEDNTISLPLAGVVPVAGMTEDDLRTALHDRLEKPMKNPQVEVFVAQYLSREVAVVGMVHKPGLYSITSRTDTILDMIDRAGGMTAEASSRALFVPASSASTVASLALAKNLATSAPDSLNDADPEGLQARASDSHSAEQPDRVAPDPAHGRAAIAASSGQPLIPSAAGAIDPIDIDLANAARDSQLDIPVRPGDTIIVPAAGEVMVDGWVQNPGAFHIVPGMTAFSAVSAAGGALFSQTAEILRTAPDGSRTSIPIDLSAIRSRTAADVPVQAGDVVFVERSAVGAVPYALYALFSKFGTGMYLPAL